ncbi:MAG: ABC transporter permease [Pirellula sp.]|jgi:ABC-type transport system involved in multi-copper enzyme maturation permease subunit|nr:ABC transporter permease [Pirellula sp.]
MRPYFAVLYDSFLESVKSKVLWILLGAWTLVLAGLFPLSLTSGESYKIAWRTLSGENSAKLIMDKLALASAGKGSQSDRAIYAKLPNEFQRLMQQRQAGDRKIVKGLLVEALNKVLLEKDLYTPEAWPKAVRRKEIKELIDKEPKSDLDIEKLNRKLLDLSFPGQLSSTDGQATWFTYLGIKLGQPLPLSLDSMRPFIERGFFPLVMRIGLGMIAMLIAIVITSSMIPDMFQAGSMHLLLSKPISRSLLFLTKFAGGCIFVAINIVYLLVGLYFYAGIQLRIWNEGILWCVPLFVFMFMVYYAVSALTGLIWKNPIICVVVTACFWGVCFTIGLIQFFFNITLNTNQQSQKIFAVYDTVLTVNQQGSLHYWNSAARTWQVAYGVGDQEQILGPVWIESQKSLYFARMDKTPFGIGPRQDPRMSFARTPDLADPSDTTFTSKPWEDSRLDSGPEMPSRPKQMLPWKDSLVVFNEEGLFEYDANSSNDEKQFAGVTSVLKSFGLGSDKAIAGFNQILKAEFPKPSDIGIAPSFQTIVAYRKGEFVAWKAKGESMAETGRLPLGFEKDLVAVVGCNDRFAIVCPNGKPPVVVDINEMKIVRTMDEIGPKSVKQVLADKNDNLAILDRDGDVWVTNNGETAKRPALSGQGNALAMCFTKENLLWVAHSVKNADCWSLSEQKVTQSIRPKLSVLEMVYRYVVNPFYLANPKPAAVNETIEYMLQKPNNKSSIALDRVDLENPKEELDPWQPIWSNTVFVVVMLAISCWYLYRQDL